MLYPLNCLMFVVRLLVVRLSLSLCFCFTCFNYYLVVVRLNCNCCNCYCINFFLHIATATVSVAAASAILSVVCVGSINEIAIEKEEEEEKKKMTEKKIFHFVPFNSTELSSQLNSTQFHYIVHIFKYLQQFIFAYILNQV